MLEARYSLLKQQDGDLEESVPSHGLWLKARIFFATPRKVVLLCVSVSVLLLCAMVLPSVIFIATHPPITLSPGSYLAATFHDVADVIVYNVTNSGLIKVGRLTGGGIRMSALRLMLLMPDMSMLVAQSVDGNSAIWILPSACSGAGLRMLFRSKLQHPYGLARNSAGVVYVTNQNSATLVNYSTSRTSVDKFSNVVNPRGVAVDPVMGKVYVALTTLNLVGRFDENTTVMDLNVTVQQPIGVLFWSGFVFVGSAGTNSVAVIDTTLGRVIQQLTHPLLQHPAGLAMDTGGMLLFVWSQDNSVILSWNVSNVRNPVLQSTFAENVFTRPEGLLRFDCF
jgi:DNA-binding beta-propeller fold protein YncE